jgi:hypothetical protein
MTDFPPTARPELVEGSSFVFSGLEEGRTALRLAQGERQWVGIIELWYEPLLGQVDRSKSVPNRESGCLKPKT